MEVEEVWTVVDSAAVVELAVVCAETEAARAKAATVAKKRMLNLVKLMLIHEEYRKTAVLAERVYEAE